VAALLVAEPGIDRVIGADSTTTELKELLEGTGAVVHVGMHAPEGADASTSDVDDVARLLEAAGDAGVEHVVLLSDATVYGAWANNAVPLTEDAPLRPNPGFLFAAERAEIERLALEWRDDHPGSSVTLLRPAPVVAKGERSWLARALRLGTAVPAGEDEPPAQLVHLEDLAAAVVLAVSARLDGPHNVAPDGWIPGDQLRALAGGGPRLRLPERAARRFAAWRWRWGFAAPPPEVVPYTLHPWVIANDRLRAAGWEPTTTNEEAFVEAHEAGPWATLSPRRRQELALGASGVVLVGAVTATVVALRRASRRRR
jgi:nucleoside-diphosphate-sugar epimerase